MGIDNDYTPHRWIIIKINNLYKVLAGWNGGYLDSDCWKLNSGVIGVVEEEDKYIIKGYSGSSYICYKKREGLTSLTRNILAQLNEMGVNRASIFEILNINKEGSND